MRTSIKSHPHSSLVILLIVGLILAPVMPGVSSARESDAASEGQLLAQDQGVGSGVDVSGTPVKKPVGKGALPPPADTAKPSEDKKPVESAQEKKVPEGIGASAGTAGTAGAGSGGGIALGWKIGAGILGLGLLVGIAAGGGGGGGGGGSSTPTHSD